MNQTLEDYFNPNAIRLAYHRVSCWQERIIKDRIGLKSFGNSLETNCIELSKKIVDGAYKPRAGIKFFMPKASLTQRTKTLLFVEDAIMYQAIANKIGERVLPKVEQHSHFVYGSVLSKEVRRGLDVFQDAEPDFFFFKFWRNLYQQFATSIINTIEKDKVRFKFETDITGFFDSIPHYNLLDTLSREFGVEDEILDILSECFNKWSGTKERSTPGIGIPQGPAPSYLFANLLLYQLDERLISHGHKYYRYMDDIHIYGYTREELLDVLIQIDNYTKGHGLSINAKKTNIDKVSDNAEDETVKELKKIKLVSFSEDDIELIITDSGVIEPSKVRREKEINESGIQLSQQDNEEPLPNPSPRTSVLQDPHAITKFWKEQYRSSVADIKSLFNVENNQVIPSRENIKENEFLGSLFQFVGAINALKDFDEPTDAEIELLPVWLYIYKTYFWKANVFSPLLQLYKNDSYLKSSLVEMYRAGFAHYEWVRYHILSLLSFTSDFTEEELRNQFFSELRSEDSVIVRVALYRLLFLKTKSKQFKSTLQIQLKKETNQYLRLNVLDFLNSVERDRDNVKDLLQNMGI